MKRAYLIITMLLLSACGAVATPTTAPDLFVDAVISRATADAMNQQAQLREAYLTGTAQAPIVAITETAAAQSLGSTATADAMQIQKQYWTVTAQSVQSTETAAMTATAMAWTPTPNATMTSVFAASYMEATKQANLALEDDQRLERVRMTNKAKAFALYMFGLVFLILGVALAYVLIKRMAYMPTPVDERGKPQPMLDVVDAIWNDVDRATNGIVQLKSQYIKQLPAITAERQDAVTMRAQLVDLQTRRARLPKGLPQEQGTGLGRQEIGSGLLEAGLFPRPAWSELSAWHFDKERIPLGKSEQGLEHWDVKNFPHLAVFGMTRSGKSMRCLRPVVSMLIASGQLVVLVGKETDYLPFIGHPNVVFVPVYELTERGEALKYFNVLDAAVKEKTRRLRLMAEQGLTLWQGPRTFLVFDELGNSIVEMPDAIGDDTLRKARSIVNEAGKTGMSLLFSSQRPKGFRDLTTQCGRAVFQVESTEEKKYALAYRNADKLPDVPSGYFYRKFSSVKVLGAFEPSDEEIRALIGQYQGYAGGDADWTNAIVQDMPKRLPDEETPKLEDGPETLESWVRDLNEKEARVVELFQQAGTGLSDSEIAASAFGYTNGDKVRKVQELIRRYHEFMAKTTTTGENSPILRAATA